MVASLQTLVARDWRVHSLQTVLRRLYWTELSRLSRHSGTAYSQWQSFPYQQLWGSFLTAAVSKIDIRCSKQRGYMISLNSSTSSSMPRRNSTGLRRIRASSPVSALKILLRQTALDHSHSWNTRSKFQLEVSARLSLVRAYSSTRRRIISRSSAVIKSSRPILIKSSFLYLTYIL